MSEILNLKASKVSLKKIDYLPFYLLDCSKLKPSKPISLKTIQRVIRSSCKTTLLDNSILCFRLKNTKSGVMIKINPFVFSPCTVYFDVSCSKLPHIKMCISAGNNHELMRKINHTYKLLNA